MKSDSQSWSSAASTRAFASVLIAAAVLVGPTRVRADGEAPHEASAKVAPKFELEFGGYGEMDFAFHDYGPDATGEGGSPYAPRGVFDMSRMVFEVEGELPADIEFEAEIEFEHGGTGAAMELEYEEFGEYETEVEKGGEVLLEELYLKKTFFDALSIKAGRFYVALGGLYSHYRPTHYLGSLRPESETTVVPGVWDEMGLELSYKTKAFNLVLQAVNGLDSTGFSSQFWVASGHQGRFETIRASDMALVGRGEFTGIDGLRLGASGYYAFNTNNNRPKPDLDDVKAPLLLASVHGMLDRGFIRARASLIWGRLWEAETISENNRRLSNFLNVLRSPIADEAISAWAELGWNAGQLLLKLPAQHRLEHFVRGEYYDTMFKVGGETFDNPRFEVTLLATGLAYTYAERVVSKVQYSHRSRGSDDFRAENTVRLTLGFAF